MTYQRGDAVLIPVPFTNLQQRKIRPAVVLRGPDYHATEPDLILGAITTNLAAATARLDDSWPIGLDSSVTFDVFPKRE